MQHGYVLGIDIGTTFTAAAVSRDGRATVCTLGTRAQSIPTVVAISHDGQLVVGEAAERRATTDPSHVAREFKRRLGDTTPLVLSGHPYTPQALMAHVLRHVVREVTIAEDGPPSEVVLTHPAHFGPYKRDLMQEVIRLADIANAQLITEPEAAAIAYAQKATIESGRTVAVYDLGGGTFDAALVRRTSSGGFELVGAADGIDRLGGIDFDQILMELVIEHAGLGPDELDGADPGELVALRTRCRDAKEALSVEQLVDVRVGVGGVGSVTVTRDEFAAAIKSRVLETVESMQRVIRSSGMQSEQIDRVLLVGGSSRIPLVAETVRTRLGLPVAVDANPKYAICTGAALAVDRITGPHSAGVEGGDATRTAPVQHATAAPPTQPLPPAPVHTPPPPADVRKRNTLIAIGAVAVLGVAGLIIALSGGDEPSQVAGVGSTAITSAAPPPGTRPALTTTPVPSPTQPPVAATQPTVPATTPVPVTTPPSPPTQPTEPTETTAPVPTAVTVAMDSAVSLRGIDFNFSQLVFDPVDHTVELSLDATSQSRGAVEPTEDGFSLRSPNGDYFSLDLQLTSELSGIGVSSPGTLSASDVPDEFTVDGSRLVLGDNGDHQAIIEFSGDAATVIEDLAPAAIDVSGTVTTNEGVAFTATGAELVAWKCEGSSPDMLFVNSPLDEYALVITGDLTVGESPSSGFLRQAEQVTTITDESEGFTRLVFPDGTVVAAATTVADSLKPGDQFPDARICFNGLTFPLDGSYELQLLAGGTFDVGVGTMAIDIPDGVSVVEDTSIPIGDATPMDATVWLRGLALHLQQITHAEIQQLLQMTADVTNTSRVSVDDVEDPLVVRFDDTDFPVDVIASSPLTGEVTTRLDLRANNLPVDFDVTEAQLVFGKDGSHQAIIDLGTGTPIEPVDPVDVPVDATLDTNYGIQFHATFAQLVPWQCSGDSDHIAFANSPADEFSLLITGDLEVVGPVGDSGATLTPDGGFTRLVLPDGTELEASTTIENNLLSGDYHGDGRVCFSGLVAPFGGDYILQMNAGPSPDNGGQVGELTITVPGAGLVSAEAPSPTSADPDADLSQIAADDLSFLRTNLLGRFVVQLAGAPLGELNDEPVANAEILQVAQQLEPIVGRVVVAHQPDWQRADAPQASFVVLLAQPFDSRTAAEAWCADPPASLPGTCEVVARRLESA